MFNQFHGHANVLLVDDDLELVAMVAELLANAGMTVQTAGSADEALKALELGTPDVLVLDVMLPDANGSAN